jgi:hypothetical protein
MVPRRRPSHARWPFWVLLAAWICAHSPQLALYTVVTWIAEARTFSHQHELTRSVAHLLKKETASSRVAYLVRQAKADGPVRPGPAIPADAVLRKIELAIQLSDGPAPLAEEPRRFFVTGIRIPERLRPAPPQEPPRGAAA